MRALSIIGGGLLGLVFGVLAGFGAALFAMRFSQPKNDGGFGMLEMLVCLPTGSHIGLISGLYWGFTR